MPLSLWVFNDTGRVAQVVEDGEETSKHVASPADTKENMEKFGADWVFATKSIRDLDFLVLKLHNAPRCYTLNIDTLYLS